MADNQTRERVGKPAGNTLSAIDLALADLAENTAVKRDGEFTTGDISKASGRPVALVRHDADKMVDLGKWLRRKVGNVVFYRRA